MTTLDLYCNQILASKGMLHLAKLRGLRWYIQNSTNEELLEQIRRMTNLKYFRILQEAGLKQPMLDAMHKRYDELVARRTRK